MANKLHKTAKRTAKEKEKIVKTNSAKQKEKLTKNEHYQLEMMANKIVEDIDNDLKWSMETLNSIEALEVENEKTFLEERIEDLKETCEFLTPVNLYGLQNIQFIEKIIDSIKTLPNNKTKYNIFSKANTNIDNFRYQIAILELINFYLLSILMN